MPTSNFAEIVKRAGLDGKAEVIFVRPDGTPEHWEQGRSWDAAQAIKKLKVIPKAMVCDALLDQDIFAGVGNIIKNEVLFITEVNPKSIIGNIPAKKIKEIVTVAREYSFDFLKWKKAFELRKHWLAYSKTICPRCDIRFKREQLGVTHRRTFFCTNCQVLYESRKLSVLN